MQEDTKINEFFYEENKKRVLNLETLIDFKNPQIKQEIIQIINQYLDEEGYLLSKTVLQDEGNVKGNETKLQKTNIHRIKQSIFDGKWDEVEKLFNKTFHKQHQHFLFSIFKQQFLEQLELNEYQKAYSHLIRKMKPLENFASPNEFKELCYLLTCDSLRESSLFKNWEGFRQVLVTQLESLFLFETPINDSNELPQSRLKSLLQKAFAYQIEFSRYKAHNHFKISSLVTDYSPCVIPNSCRYTLNRHVDKVKCISYSGNRGDFLVSGSSDKLICVWDVEKGLLIKEMKGHTSRIWDIQCCSSGKFCISGSSDRTIKFWNIQDDNKNCIETFEGHNSDVYAIHLHNQMNHFFSSGYDCFICFFDLTTKQIIQKLHGHNHLVPSLTLNKSGNLLISGSKDTTIKFWDIRSGICVKTLESHFGEITSVQINDQGDKLLVASKDNTNRIWDLRMVKPIQKFRGHYNICQNFIKAGFGQRSQIVIGGSEDGQIYIWNANTGNILQQLRTHSGTSYNSIWNEEKSLLASCGDDGYVKLWWYDNNNKEFL